MKPPFPWADHVDLMKRLRERGETARYIRLELMKVTGLSISSSAVKARIGNLEATGVIGRRDPFVVPIVHRCKCGVVIDKKVTQCRACYRAAGNEKPLAVSAPLYEESGWETLPDGVRMRRYGDLR